MFNQYQARDYILFVRILTFYFENVSVFSHIALRFFSTSSFRHIAEPVRWHFTLSATIYLISIASSRQIQRFCNHIKANIFSKHIE